MSEPAQNRTPLRWGILSTAHINRALIPPLRNSPRNELWGVASRDPRRAQDYAKEWGIPKSYGSYEALLEDQDIDVLYNPLPNHLHAEWTVKAVHAGKHVLCEKPLALSLKEVDEIANAAENNQRVVAEAFMYRHHPQTIKVKELLDSGAIGKVQVVNGAFTFALDNPLNVRFKQEMGGGSVWDVGCYPISFARFVIDQEPVEAFGWQVTGTTGVDEVFIGQLRFPDEVLVQFDCGFRSPYRTRMEIVGSDGYILVPDPFKPGENEKIILSKGGQIDTIAIPGQELYIGEVEDMADCILTGKAQRVTLADSRNNIAAILALLNSAREGQPVLIKD
jgi:D-xylose 1-dehydrogenase (NADP+, D-xylono-1,5-lactone-forming)